MRNIISHNTGATWGGGIFIGGWENVDCRPSIIGNLICHNEGIYGGAIWCEKSVVLENNLLSGNDSEFGGGITVWGTGEVSALNNTIVENNATSNGGGVAIWADVRVFLMNNILWNNFPGGQIHNESPIPGHYYYNDIQGGWPGMGNIDIDPQFADTLFHLLPNSYCIGLGRSSIIIGDSSYQVPLIDLEGNPRPNPIDTLVDMGAYETPFPGGAQLINRTRRF